MIVTEYGSVLTQKKEPAMVFIKPFIDLKENLLILRCKGMSSYCKYRMSVKNKFSVCLAAVEEL